MKGIKVLHQKPDSWNISTTKSVCLLSIDTWVFDINILKVPNVDIWERSAAPKLGSLLPIPPAITQDSESRCSSTQVTPGAYPKELTWKQIYRSGVHIQTEVATVCCWGSSRGGAVVLLVLQLIAPCWGQIGPLTRVPFSLFEGISTSLMDPVCNRMVCHKGTHSLIRWRSSVYTSTGAAEGQAEREGEREDRPLYLAIQVLILE